MATKRLLVDAIHPEETRIVVTSGNKLEEFDFESASRRQLRGNIYLAKVTRVEPSLQAAFIEYGGNRHGFLAFSEIHPDYYQIPVADREALLRDQEDEDEDHDDESAQTPHAPTEADAEADPQDHSDDEDSHIEQAPVNAGPVESIGGDALEEVPERRKQSVSRRNNYKIQEVIKRRQVMLVQVVKEERGNKGAALTTYLSLAGRYSVLMPNTARGGGISRKITNAADRKRLKEIVGDLEVPQGQGIILRTAGASRTKAEVKRDFEYLQRLWENVRSLTLKSQAPCLVYEEGSLIKRTIRDLYSKDIDEVFVAGDDAYREAKDFMRMIMPSHAKNVQLYKEDQPIFSKYNVESQLDQMFSPQVTLPSGGYIVINPTEALVSIDVNSGRSTKEHNIEDTAHQTNLEAADEVARQLRLRDLAGLIVIDFIDMVENRSNRAVERRLKDALKNDRARIQVGRISHFGLMEMSRQRIRFGVVESSTHTCPVCSGTGLVRSVESVALMVMRAVEDHVLRRPGQSINLRVPTDVALYILNSKRHSLNLLESKYQLSVTVVADDHLTSGHYAIEKGEPRAHHFLEARASEHVRVDTAAMDDFDDNAVEDEEDDEEDVTEAAPAATRERDHDAEGEGDGTRRRRRRRRRGGQGNGGEERQPRQGQAQSAESVDAESAEDDSSDEGEETGVNATAEDGDEPRKRRRRGRRGGRRNRRGPGEGNEAGEGSEAADGTTIGQEAAEAVGAANLTQDAIAETMPPAEMPAVEDAPKPRRGRRKPAEAPVAEEAATEAVTEAAPEAVVSIEDAPAKPKRTRKRAAAPSDAEAVASAEAVAPAEAPAPEAAAAEDAPAKPRRTRRTAKASTAEAAPAVEAKSAAPAPKAAAPKAEPAPEAEAAEKPAPRRARKELPAEGIVVSSTNAKPEAEPEAEDASKPKKAGWWQRGFFGG